MYFIIFQKKIKRVSKEEFRESKLPCHVFFKYGLKVKADVGRSSILEILPVLSSMSCLKAQGIFNWLGKIPSLMKSLADDVLGLCGEVADAADKLVLASDMLRIVKEVVGLLPSIVLEIVDLVWKFFTVADMDGFKFFACISSMFVNVYRIVSNVGKIVGELERVLVGPRLFECLNSFFEDNEDFFTLSQGSLSETFVATALLECLPSPVAKVIKNFRYLTNFKVLDDSNVVADVMSKLLEGIVVVFSYCLPQYEDYVRNMVVDLPFGKRSVLFGRMATLVKKFNENAHIVSENNFQFLVKDLVEDLKKFKEKGVEYYKPNVHFTTMSKQFDVVVDSVRSFMNTTRQEPVAFVLESPPGKGKTVLMSSLVKLFGRSVYTHSVPDVNSGKDFYDDYNGEKVFIMDDVGQQGPDQYKHLINQVSSIKYPLQCAKAELKNTKFFSSEIIIATTNRFRDLRVTPQDGIADLRALYRRCYLVNMDKVNFKYSEEAKSMVYDGSISIESYSMDNSRYMLGGPFITKPTLVCRDLPVSEVAMWLCEQVCLCYKEKMKQAKINAACINRNELVAEMLKRGIDVDAILSGEDFEDAIEAQGNAFVCERTTRTLKQKVGEEELEDTWDSLKIGAGYDLYNLCKFHLSEEGSVGSFVKTYADVLVYLAILVFVYFLFSLIDYFLISKPKPTTSQSIIQKLRSLPSVELEQAHVVKAIQKNVKYVEISYADRLGSFVKAGTCAVLSGRDVITNYHNIANYSSSHPIYLTVHDGQSTNYIVMDHIEVKIKYLSSLDDLVILSLPQNAPRFYKNIAHLFLDVPDGNENYLVSPHSITKISLESSSKLQYKSPNDYLGELTTSDFKYSFQAFVGLCGSLVVSNTGLIKGVHVAGSDEVGYARVFKDRSVFDALRSSVFCFDLKSEDRQQDGSSVAFIEGGLSASVVSKSGFVKSPIYGVFPEDRQPADVKAYGGDTIYEIAKKSYVPLVDVDPNALKFAELYLQTVVQKFETCSERENVLGFENCSGIPKDTSPGYGFSKDKRDYIDFEKGELKEEFRKQCNALEYCVKTGDFSKIEEYPIFQEQLKIELRNVVGGKVKDPRSFKMSPLHYTFLLRKYLVKCLSNLRSRRHETGFMVGINPFAEWGKVYDKLLTYDKVFDGDVGKFDGRMLSQFQQMVNRVLAEKSSDPEMVSGLLQFLVTTPTVIKNRLLITTHSMPSGAAVTADYNSLITSVICAYNFYQVYKTVFKKGPSLSFYLSNVYSLKYGDDVVVAVSKQAAFFNALTYATACEGLGLEFTTSDKKKIERPFCSMNEISFLKRRFVFHRQMRLIVPALDLVSVKSTLNWIHDEHAEDATAIILQKLYNFQRELFLHEDVYSQLLEHVYKFCCERDIPFTPLPVSYLEELYKNNPSEYAESIEWIRL